jgi:hypothetical protein
LGRGSDKRLIDWGRFAATHPRGLTSNRHAGRPDRWSIRAFAFGLDPTNRSLALGVATGHQGAGCVPAESWGFEQENDMRSRWMIAACVAACFVSAPAAAQGQAGGVPTETEERHNSRDLDDNILWNIVGLIGLLGLRGLWRESDNDGYTDDPV